MTQVHSLIEFPLLAAFLRVPRYFLLAGFLPSNSSLSRSGCGLAGPAGGCVLGETRRAVQRTINSPLLFCKLLLLKKFPSTGISPSNGTLLVTFVTRLSIKLA